MPFHNCLASNAELNSNRLADPHFVQHRIASWRLAMRFPAIRKFAVAAVPVVIVAGALAYTAAPAHAIQDCNPNLLQQSELAEEQGDSMVETQEEYIDEGNYEAAQEAYILAGQYFATADALRGLACR